MDYKIITDSSCNLSDELIAENEITVVPFYVSFGDSDYLREGTELPIRELYDRMITNPHVYPKTSLPSVQDYLEVFSDCIKKGVGVLCICISSKFSGSYTSACTARDLILEDFPDARILVIDSIVNTVLQGQFVLEAAKMKKNGLSLRDNAKNLERIKKSGRIFFTVGSIDYLKAGGRIGKLKGMAASVLSIKPLITLKNGEIYPSGLIRSRAKGLSKIIEQVKAYIKEMGTSVKNCSLAVGYGFDIEEGRRFCEELKNALKEHFGFEPQIILAQIGATIAVHTGPYPIGVGVILHYDAPELATESGALSFT